ncbi:probable LEU5 - mitochondrial coenzyme A transporter- member of the mitochondrial carrier (MCF) family [Ustilago trichophora]|uniref:Probable LEU5 - mitochondrial coenzyme A transporter- member of the mitochondrial carrier (MCF) family n=1 Tax=Ustilago trichophora TaxID=86804 RepID=A0A5C3DZV2_9BASI|nr:probable LEU5 - mitochondrial coenzyme A transporter- member of the mitochondrial carrier (MCF) family [Ustilago trichophora]
MAAPRPKHPPLCETDHAASDPRDSTHLSHPSQSSYDLMGKGRAYDDARDPFSISSTSSSIPPATTSVTSILGDKSDKTSWNYVLRSGFAGGIAGCVAKSAIAPLDRVKILFQAQNPEFQKYSGKWLGVFQAGRDIVRSDGPAALFQGHSATLMRIFPYAAIKYMAYDKFHFYLMPTKQSETSGRLFLAGSASGVLSVFLTYPLELIRVRLAFETKRKRQKGGLRRIIGMIYREGATEAPFSSDARKRAARLAQQAQQANLSTSATSSIAAAASSTSSIESALRATDPNVPSSAVPAGNRLLSKYPILKFYRGFSVTVMGMIPYAGTSFLVFGRCKTMLQDLFPPSEPSSDTPGSRRKWYWPSKTVVDLSAGALAGALSQTAAYPFEVIRRRQQVGGIIRPGAMLGMWETAAWIYKTSGWRGFYVGLSIGFLKVVPMTSISFAVWLGMKRQMGI